jgi:hypothetical protein
LTTKKNVDTKTPIDFKEELILRGWPIGNTSNYGIDIKKICEKSSNYPPKKQKKPITCNLRFQG